MEPEGSLPYSQEPGTGRYSEPRESSPHPLIMFLYGPFLHHLPFYA
jgi:hypothetical protein